MVSSPTPRPLKEGRGEKTKRKEKVAKPIQDLPSDDALISQNNLDNCHKPHNDVFLLHKPNEVPDRQKERPGRLRFGPNLSGGLTFEESDRELVCVEVTDVFAQVSVQDPRDQPFQHG